MSNPDASDVDAHAPERPYGQNVYSSHDDLRDEQRENLEVIGMLVSGVAHDFNNILQSIIGYAQILAGAVESDPSATHCVEQIMIGGQRATDLVNQILAFGRRTPAKRAPMQLQLVIKEALRLMLGSLPSTVELIQDIDNDAPNIVTSPTSIHQLLMNLCTNAYQAMDSHQGQIRIALRSLNLKTPQDIQALPQSPVMPCGCYVMLSVADNGCGMEPDTLQRIYDPYFTTRQGSGGTGLGMATVMSIVRSHNAYITVSSQPGGGSEFRIYFPAAETKFSFVEALPEAAHVAIEGKERVMVVDDEPTIAQVFHHGLGQLGYDVTIFGQSRQALKAFMESPFKWDVIVTDMVMPQMNGEEFARKVFSVRPDMPIILCTGYDANINQEKALNIGFRCYLEKPIIHRELARNIRRVLEKGQHIILE